jgi:hypothetical protein
MEAKSTDPIQVWYEVRLHVRGPWKDWAPGKTRLEVDASTGVKVTLDLADLPSGKAGKEAAVLAAAKEFREMGLGTVMDLPDVRVDIEAVLA